MALHRKYVGGLLCGLLTVLAGCAHAPQVNRSNPDPDALVYRWEEGEVLHYRLQAYIKAPRVMRFYASENLDARVAEMTMGLELDCIPEPLELREQDWICNVHRVQLGGQAFPGEQANLDEIFVEYAGLLNNTYLQVDMRLDGRVDGIDLEGFSKDNDREQLRYEYLRLLVSRAFSGLELTLPANGDAAFPWRQGGSPLTMRLPTRFGTAGGVRVTHEVTGVEGDIVSIQSVGEGTVSSGQSIDSGMNNAVMMSMIGNATFDRAAGVLLTNEVNVQGALNTSSSGAGDGFFLSQYLLVEKVDSWDEVEAVEAVEAVEPVEEVEAVEPVEEVEAVEPVEEVEAVEAP